jgi:hypothetical protein
MKLNIFLVLFAVATLAIPEVNAKTTRVFSGESAWEVQRAAEQAGYDYPDAEMKCSQRCRQRWAKN